ncbi:MAG: hypothetical protein H0T79_18945 [Deltaproteobacteria bacterium]|nr:hypothetical protein [Deltaproteobacteria bacterium]
MRIAILAIALGACADPVSPPPLGDYTTWDSIAVVGDAPGHGDSYRVIYANDIARHTGITALDAVLVKELHDNAGGQPGALRSVAIMRKLRSGPAREDEGGWLFTQSDSPGGAEEHLDLCWSSCHAQAPFAGVWLDYTK